MSTIPNIIRDEISHEHSTLVARICGILASKSGSDNKTLIVSAAALHDIGKQYVPQDILNKAGKLSPQEFDLVKTHAAAGGEYLLSLIQVLFAAAIMAFEHHERPDSKGYYSIKKIHPYAKLIATADVYDALVSRRAYKPPWPTDEAKAYLLDNAGQQFDSECVALFMSCIEEIQALYSVEGSQPPPIITF